MEISEKMGALAQALDRAESKLEIIKGALASFQSDQANMEERSAEMKTRMEIRHWDLTLKQLAEQQYQLQEHWRESGKELRKMLRNQMTELNQEDTLNLKVMCKSFQGLNLEMTALLNELKENWCQTFQGMRELKFALQEEREKRKQLEMKLIRQQKFSD
ncbi:hypothetical protein Ciccas_007857 [Cichlidogyrus casuarinus]|uniref:Uncharacterized protein n=1 Tax=Cichlidogyrus casuarinus TaxID=1844966 RepID=A0ABD2Q223_9PLAT